jgi:hypothetical protein
MVFLIPTKKQNNVLTLMRVSIYCFPTWRIVHGEEGQATCTAFSGAGLFQPPKAGVRVWTMFPQDSVSR